MTVFNEEYERSRPWVREDEMLVVRGKASLDEYSGNMRVTAEELFDIASARSTFAHRLELGITPDNRVNVSRLKELLSPYRDGKCPVMISYRNLIADAQLKLGEEWRVTLHNDLLEGLNKLLGTESVRIHYTV